MQRGQRDTLVDPEALRPTSQFMGPSTLQGKRTSTAPLLNFDGGLKPHGQIPNTRSVFGVDKIWERELAKLKTLEDADKAEQAKIDALEARIAEKKAGKGGAKSRIKPPDMSDKPPSPVPTLPMVPLGGPPMAAAIQPLRDDDDDSDSDEYAKRMAKRRESNGTLGVQGWFNGSDDEDDLERRNSAGPRVPQFTRKVSAASNLPQIQNIGLESESDEDIPLAAARKSYYPPAARRPPAVESDSDEDKPISALRQQKGPPSGPTPPAVTKPTRSGSLSLGFGPSLTEELGLKDTPKKPADSSDEDEVPLGLRHPDVKVAPPAGADSDDDEVPLGARMSVAPNVLLQQQYMMAMQQQQQMMMQAQLRQTMAFNQMGMMGPAMMPPGAMSVHSFGSPGMVPPALAPPGAVAAHSRVDKWRREVGSDPEA